MSMIKRRKFIMWTGGIAPGFLLQACGGDGSTDETVARRVIQRAMAPPGSRLYQTASGGTVYGGLFGGIGAAAPDWMRGGIDVYGLNSTNYVIGWPAASHSTPLTYEVSIDNGGSWTSVGTSLSASISGRTPGTVDQVRVRALSGQTVLVEELARQVTLPATGAPTVIVRTIGVGGDYATPQEWQDAASAFLGTNNLITANVVWEGWCLNQEFVGTFASPVCDLNGHVTSPSCYLHLTAAPGASFKDHVNRRTNPLRYNPAVGACLTANQGSQLTPTVEIREGYAKVSRLQIRSTGNGVTGWGGWAVHSSSPYKAVYLDDCIVESGSYQLTLAFNYGAHRTRNCAIINVRPVSAQSVEPMQSIAEMNNGSQNYNTLFIALGARAPIATVARSNDCLFKNCGFFGVNAVQNLAAAGAESPGPTYVNCFTDAPGELPAGCTFVALDEGNGSGFESLTVGSHDVRLRQTSAMRGAGLADSTHAPRDIVGTARLTATDVGPWQTY